MGPHDHKDHLMALKLAQCLNHVSWAELLSKKTTMDGRQSCMIEVMNQSGWFGAAGKPIHGAGPTALLRDGESE